ncbi:uncharacterized protein LOC144175835 [Haemaphysalis longicornis]
MKARIEDGIVYSPFPDVEVPCCSFYQAARKALLDDPCKPALSDGSILLTRGELLVRCQRYAAGFQHHGVQPGDRICVYLKDNTENFAAMWGCVFAGASIMLTRAFLTERELRHQINDCDCTHVFTDVEFAEEITKAASSLKLKGWFATGTAKGFIAINDFVNIDEVKFMEVPIEDPRNSVLAICYTSGTTGQPKGVVGTHYGFVAHIATTEASTTYAGDVTLVSAPLMYIAGFLSITLGVLLGQFVVMMSPKADVHRFRELITKYKVTTVELLPTRLMSLATEMLRLGIRLPSIREVAVGGDALSEAAYLTILSAFDGVQRRVNGYAMTEALGVVCVSYVHGTRRMDIGFPVASAQVKVVDEKTRKRLGANQTGEICFRTSTMMKEYYKKPKETADLFDEEGWCKSGDAGYYDEDGRLHFVQRIKQIIKSMCHYAIPAEIENLLLKEHKEEISEVAIVGLSNPQSGEAPAAAVVLRDHGRKRDGTDLADLAKRMKSTVDENLPIHSHLHGGVFFFDSLPKTETMKVNRPSLVEACASKTAF